MKKFVTSFVSLALAVGTSFAADNPYDSYSQANYGRAGISQARFRAPTLPIPTTPTTPTAPTPTAPTAPVPTPVAPVVKYSVDNCMNDMTVCIENSLPNGLPALFNADLRNSIVNGMSLCSSQVDKCINDATRIDGNKAYYAKNDVWVDFNSRVIQPQYYSHVLMKTGLTPNQAENTCWLLDKNTYGTSFTAVSKSGNVTSEYAKDVTPYNQQGGTKNGTMGSVVNSNGEVDAERGHYARWDATAGECLVRVAAYNKDDLISNKWLGLGDDKPAEAWVNAGNSFSCKKDTFDFNLMNATKSAALIGMGGGTVVGAGVGALVAHTKLQDTSLNVKNCSVKGYVGLLERSLIASGVSKDYVELEDTETCNQMFANDKEQNASEGAPKDAKGNPLNFYYYGDSAVSRVAFEKTLKEENGMGKLAGAGIGAAAGLTAGGVATAITAFIEANNISCHIGDGLDSVAFGKSGRVKSLKEYYVLWNLRLPDTVMPTQTVTECNSWNTACNSINNIADCAMATIIYKPQNAVRSTQVETACVVSGSTCVTNNPVAVSHGACQ